MMAWKGACSAGNGSGAGSLDASGGVKEACSDGVLPLVLHVYVGMLPSAALLSLLSRAELYDAARQGAHRWRVFILFAVLFTECEAACQLRVLEAIVTMFRWEH